MLRFGVQFDARTVRTGRPGDLLEDVRCSDELHAGQVAGYLAKYATKSTSESGVPRPHHRRMEYECTDLSKRAMTSDPDSPYFLLGKWARMLGF